MTSYDALVIGGGPAGLAAALYLCRAGRKVALAEMLAPGGQLLRTAKVENYPGFPKGVAGWELADYLAGHLAGYSLDRYNDAVTAFTHEPGANRVTVGKETLLARTVIICSGSNPRSLGLADETRFLGRGLSYCAICDGNFFRDQVVAVVGGGDSALEESLYLSKIVRELYLVHRRGEFRASKILYDKISQTANIKLELYQTVVSLNGETALESLTLEDTRTRAQRILAVDGLFVFVGALPQGSFLPPQLERDANGFVITDTEMRTSLPGIFAAGDIRSKHCRQIVTAAGDGATAATSASLWLEQQP